MQKEKVTRKKPLLVKGKITRCFIFTLISTVKEREQGREVGHQRWQIESLVTNVPRHLRIERVFGSTSSFTVAIDTIVHSATNHSAKLEV